MAELKFVPLADIEMISNYRDVVPVSEKDPDVIELAESIQKVGVLQAVLLRPKPGKPNKYQLVFGHRRYVAAGLAKLEALPSSIQEVADGDILEFQVTENLQRKDVHPLDEAVAFKAYMDQKKVGTEELSHRFGKSLSYIAQRLSFTGLIPEAMKDFKSGILLVGHAVQLARLQPADQKEVISQSRNTHHKNGVWYDSVDEMKDVIEQEIMHELTHAAFDKKDAKLVKKAGPCITCPKRSGAGLLFPDIKEKDRCFDGACFKAKTIAHTLVQVADLVLAPNPIPVVVGYGSNGIDPAVKKMLSDNKVKLLEQPEDYSEASKSTAGAISALQVNGSDAGRVVRISLKSTAKAKEARGASANATEAETAHSIDAQIDGIRERAKRNIELDAEKVHRRIVEAAREMRLFKEPNNLIFDMTTWEQASVYYFAYKKMHSDDQKLLAKFLGLPTPKNFANFYDGDERKLLEKLAEAPPGAFAFIARSAVKSEMLTAGALPTNTDGFIVRKIAEEYFVSDVAQFELEQKEKADKRIEREKDRIKDLQAKKKELLEKKAAPAKKADPKPAVKKSAAKKTAKPKGPKPKASDFDNGDSDQGEGPHFTFGHDVPDDDD